LTRDVGSKRELSTVRTKRRGGALGAAFILALAATGLAAEKQPKPLKIVGLATEVEPTQVTIRDIKGNEVTVQPKEDFTEKVAVGSKVTAWYFPGGAVNELQWLEYPLENAFVSPHQFCPQIKKIILLPSSDAGDADGLFDALEGFLQGKRGWFVAHRMLAEEIRNRASQSNSTLKFIDPAAGNMNLTAFTQAHRKLIRRIAADTRADAVLETNVELVQVNFRSQRAVWDGAQQAVSSTAARTLAFVTALPVDGHVPASTVVLKLWDAQGKLLWSNRRGFCVLAHQQGVGNKFRDYSISEALQDTASVEKWLATVFASWLPDAQNPPAAAASH